MHTARKTQALLWLLRLAVSAALLALLWHSGALADFVGRASGGDAARLAAAAALLLSVTTLNAARWRRVVRAAGFDIDLRRAQRFVLVGTFFNQTIFPALAGDVVRIWLARDAGIPTGVTARTVVVDRALALAGLALLTTISLLVGSTGALRVGVELALPLGVFVAAIAAILVVLAHIGRVPVPTRFARAWLSALATLTRRMFSRAAECVPTLVMSILIHVGIALAVFLIASAYAVPMQLGHCLLLVPPIMLLSMLPMSLAGWGLREGAMVVAFAHVGIAASDAFLVSAMFGGLMLALGLLGGISLLVRRVSM